MAKQSILEREKKRKKIIIKYSVRRKNLLIKLKKANTFLEQVQIHKIIEKLPRNTAQVRVRNRCWITGRSRGVYRDFGLCRHMIRNMAHNCILPGIKKASW
uniref:Small ribosomal subunit protein uS14c n=1 Tax=Phaeophyceae sp. TaxID=2249243 RepID=A0A8E5BHX8_9PHAE|nr:ribosomal protein S14 [Phaeophyceae sp.]